MGVLSLFAMHLFRQVCTHSKSMTYKFIQASLFLYLFFFFINLSFFLFLSLFISLFLSLAFLVCLFLGSYLFICLFLSSTHSFTLSVTHKLTHTHNCFTLPVTYQDDQRIRFGRKCLASRKCLFYEHSTRTNNNKEIFEYFNFFRSLSAGI